MYQNTLKLNYGFGNIVINIFSHSNYYLKRNRAQLLKENHFVLPLTMAAVFLFLLSLM